MATLLSEEMSSIDDFIVDIENGLAPGLGARAPPSPKTKRKLIPMVPLKLKSSEELRGFFIRWQVVSLDPYCYRKKLVQRFFITRKVHVRNIYDKILNQIKEVRDCYEEDLTNESDDERLTLMMLLDGTFFILCLFFPDFLYSEEVTAGNMARFLSDLHLLENQIPFMVLKAILESLEIENLGDHHFKIPNDNFDNSFISPRALNWVSDGYHHHLDKLQKLSTGDGKTKDGGIIQFQRYSVRAIVAKGVHLEPGQRGRFDIVSFSSKYTHGELTVPPLWVDEFAFHYISNLIAYEATQAPENCQSVVTSYICFLDSIVSAVEDIRALQSAGIISLSPRLPFKDREERLIRFINETARHLVPCSDTYRLVGENIVKHMETKWKANIWTWMTEVRSEYCKSPWKGIAVLAGFVLFFLTGTQTYFTVFPRKG